MKTYKIYTLGCKVNQYDSGKLSAELKRAGLSSAAKNADLAVINSCVVTKTAMIKSGRMIKLARKENPEAKIALTGCWPRAEKAKEKMAGVDLVIKTGDIKKLIKQFSNQCLKQPEIASPLINSGLAMTDKARYFIKIQDGCEQFCSYCIIPYTRGKLRSRPAEEVVTEIEQAVKAGYGEIVLSGIHLGLYDKLASLLKKLIKIKNLGRIRLSSIEITEVTDELINLMAGSRKICRHLHIPLQAGSDKILKLMNRPYDIEYFKDKIKRIRLARPEMALTTDVITGFPGETEEDFKATEKFIRQIKFSRLHVFPFSPHGKTPAAKMPDQLEEKIKALRAQILRELSLKLARDYKNKFKGRELEIAVERIRRNKIMGKTEYYFKVIADKKDDNIRLGQITKAVDRNIE